MTSMLYFLLCLYISLYYIRPFEWMEGLVGSSMFFWVGLLSILALFLASLSGRIRLFRYKTDVMMVGFVVAIILSHLSYGYVGGAVSSTRDFLPSIVGYFLVVHALDSEIKIKGFLFILIGLSVFLAYEGWLQISDGVALGGIEPLVQSQYQSDGTFVSFFRVRWFGMFNDPNDLGLALVLPVPFLVDRLLNKKYALVVLCLPLLVYGLYLTNSRGAMLSLLASVFIYLVLRYRSLKGCVVGLILAFVLIILGPSRMADISASEASAYGRIEAWYEGFQMFKSSPLFGVGAGRFTDYNPLTAHNSYLLVLAEMGIVGSLFFLGFFFYPVLWVKKNMWMVTTSREAEANRCFLAAGFGCLAGLASAMFFLSRAYILLPYMVAAFLTASINVFHKSDEPQGHDQVCFDFHWVGLGVLVLTEIVVVNLIVKFFI